MKQIYQVVLACAVMSLAIPSISFGQDYIPIFSRDYSSRLSVEIDPITFLFKGYSLHVRYQPMFSERLLIGVGTYALDLPQFFVNLNPDNRNEGWEARIRSAYFVTGEFFPKKANQGWFFGEQIGFQSYKVSNTNEAGGSTSFNGLLLMTYSGYNWHPYKGSFYIKPWLGLGYLVKVDGVNRLGSQHYDLGPWWPYFTFHVGYTF